VIFDGPFDPPAGYGASQLYIGEGGITGINFGCGQSARDLVEFQSLQDAILAPRK
jgi:hypothetical protein